MSFSALSVVLSASEDRLPRQHLADLAKCLSLSVDLTASRIDLMSEPGKRRCRMVSEHSNVHTAQGLFEQIETLPKGSLLTVFNSGPGGGIEDPSIRMQTDLRRDTMLDVWCWASAILLDTAMDVLKRPDEADGADEIPTRPDDDDLMDVDEDPRCAPWLDSRCSESLMPNTRTSYASILVEPECSRDIMTK
ncbi:hypothetical protein DFH09DRAFT_1082458 [Mycena vulgaris]|nr:hypothetical protein DFH09DRAFT_1082458 [Mycena vulgaris]